MEMDSMEESPIWNLIVSSNYHKQNILKFEWKAVVSVDIVVAELFKVPHNLEKRFLKTSLRGKHSSKLTQNQISGSKWVQRNIFLFPFKLNYQCRLIALNKKISCLLNISKHDFSLIFYNSRVKKIMKRVYFYLPFAVNMSLVTALYSYEKDQIVIVNNKKLIKITNLTSMEPKFILQQEEMPLHSKLNVKMFNDDLIVTGVSEERNFIFGHLLDGETLEIKQKYVDFRGCLENGVNYITNEFIFLGQEEKPQEDLSKRKRKESFQNWKEKLEG